VVWDSLCNTQIMTLMNLSDMNKYEIIYKHFDMHPDYRGYQVKWANDKEQAVKYICPTKPSKDGYGTTKKGARVQILEVNELPTK
jgi:hypothetical protein